jgi:hypothetical protein
MEPLEEKWGRWTTWKYINEEFLSGSLCAHILMMALLYDNSLTFPPACSSKKLESRPKGSKRVSARAPENEDVEDSDERARKRYWCFVIVAGDYMELKPLPQKKVE